AYLRLRQVIVDGTLASGTKLSERSLAASFGISAQPIREALRRLEAEGMVETRRRSGTFVASLDTEQLMEMGRIRAALEGVAAGLAARHATAADIAALRDELAAIVIATERHSAAAVADANDRFHCALHAVTRNPFLIRSLQALRAYLHIGSMRVLPRAEQRRRALEEHTAVVEAIAAGDADRAETLMHAHTLRSLLVAFPEANDPPVRGAGANGPVAAERLPPERIAPE
ncbi:MAG: GntR family transcriptional regulator, partial [Nevskia sp.]|nr:GntR family transcriptional regulator [Nevskia sp.]